MMLERLLNASLLTGFCRIDHNDIFYQMKPFLEAEGKIESAFHQCFYHFFDYT